MAQNGSVSLARCQVVAAGYSLTELHLRDPNCKGEVKEGRVVFRFDSDQNMCGGDLEVQMSTSGLKILCENILLCGISCGSLQMCS